LPIWEWTRALQLLQSNLIQTVQSIDELESGVDSSIVAHMDVEMKCLGPTYLARRAFCDWASIRYPDMENYIFQPHSLSKSVQRRDFDVLFATQAGFLCALHADAVLAFECIPRNTAKQPPIGPRFLAEFWRRLDSKRRADKTEHGQMDGEALGGLTHLEGPLDDCPGWRRDAVSG
jgi:hypothetical protein